jgi:ribonuclease VapC
MIAVDSSALIAIVLEEPEAAHCMDALETAEAILISAAVLAEVSVVASNRGFLDDLETLIEKLDIQVIPATALTAVQVTHTYEIWGKGRHPAGLNIMDCFSYAVAKMYGCPLLFIGNDFSQTDIESVL